MRHTHRIFSSRTWADDRYQHSTDVTFLTSRSVGMVTARVAAVVASLALGVADPSSSSTGAAASKAAKRTSAPAMGYAQGIASTKTRGCVTHARRTLASPLVRGTPFTFGLRTLAALTPTSKTPAPRIMTPWRR